MTSFDFWPAKNVVILRSRTVAAPVAMTICHGSNGERISFTELNTIFAVAFRKAGVGQGWVCILTLGNFIRAAYTSQPWTAVVPGSVCHAIPTKAKAKARLQTTDRGSTTSVNFQQPNPKRNPNHQLPNFPARHQVFSTWSVNTPLSTSSKPIINENDYLRLHSSYVRRKRGLTLYTWCQEPPSDFLRK